MDYPMIAFKMAEKGISQIELARKVGMTKSTLNTKLNRKDGKALDANLRGRLKEALGCWGVPDEALFMTCFEARQLKGIAVVKDRKELRLIK